MSTLGGAVDEEQLKRQVIERLQNDFYIRREVSGRFLVDDSRVRIDLLLYPQEHLEWSGFDPQWFGCEVKAPDKRSKLARLAWQCVTYAQSEFNGVRPMFVLMYPGISTYTEDRDCLSILYPLLQFANVGELCLANGGWKITFGSQRYYGTRYGKGNVKNLGTKRYVGTWR